MYEREKRVTGEKGWYQRISDAFLWHEKNADTRSAVTGE
jgi:hypothetical protein